MADRAWLQPVTIEETKGPYWASTKKRRPNRCSKDLKTLSAQAKSTEYVCCSECGQPVAKNKINEHWEAAHTALLGKDPSRSKVLTNLPPPTSLANWGLLLLNKVGWRVFRTKYAREKRLFEAQTKKVVLQGHAGFDYDVPKASRSNKPPTYQKKGKNTLSKRKGKKKGISKAKK